MEASMIVDQKMVVPIKNRNAAIIAKTLVEHIQRVQQGHAKARNITYGQLRDMAVKNGADQYATIGSGNLLWHILEPIREMNLPLGLTFLVVPKINELDYTIFEKVGVDKSNVVQLRRAAMEFDWSNIEFHFEEERRAS
jgi:hypothetical protein